MKSTKTITIFCIAIVILLGVVIFALRDKIFPEKMIVASAPNTKSELEKAAN